MSDRSPTRRPQLSVCIPTHNGRAGTLDDLLSELASQLADLGDQVEVCISDNASDDGTAAMVQARRRELGTRLRYRRNERDLGVGGNILRAVELAAGDYCWLLGSDDRPAAGAVRAVLDLIDSHPGASGFQLGMLRPSADLSEPIELLGADHPAERVTTAYTSPDAIAQALGVSQLWLSPCVVRRDRWQAVSRADPGLVDRHPEHAHGYVIGRMAQRDPLWIWCPRPLVNAGSGTDWLADETGPGMPRRVARIVPPLQRLWAELHGPGSPTYRKLVASWSNWVAGPSAAYEAKIQPGHTWRDDLRLLGVVRLAWRSRRFRRETLPWLLVPHRAFKAGGCWRWALGSGRELPRTACRTTVAVRRLPELASGHQARIPCTVENGGPHALSSRLPHPVRLAARWFDGEGRLAAEGPRTPFLPALRSGERRRVEMRVNPPSEPGEYELRIAPVQEHVAWFDELDLRNGWAGRVVVQAPGGASGTGPPISESEPDPAGA